MGNIRGFSRATGPSGWVERAGKRYSISGWEIVSLQTSSPDGRGWFRCTSDKFEGHSGEGVRVYLRNWDLHDQELDITLARQREGGAVWEFMASKPPSFEPGSRERVK